MAYTPESICNLALDELPASRIVSLNENSTEAKACKTQYPQALAELLEMHQWGFARRRVALAALVTNDRETVWSGAYGLPDDMAFPIRVLAGGGSVSSYPLLAGQSTASYPELELLEAGWSYDYAEGTLYTSAPGAVLEYAANDPELGGVSALFVKALVATLAAKIVMPIKKDQAAKQALLAQAEIYTERAKAADANRRPQRYGDFIPDAVRARWS